MEISNSKPKEFCCPNWRDKSINLLKDFFTEDKLSAASEPSSSLLKKKELIEKKIDSESVEMKNTQKELEVIESENPKLDPNKYKIQLFEQITNIVWDVECLPHEVKGYVSKPFETFALNRGEDSDFFISNYLWNLIDDKKAISKAS